MTDNQSDPALAGLQAKVAELESANAELAAQLQSADETSPMPARRRSRGRGVLAVVLIVLGSLLAPVAIVGGWSRVLLTDTDAFVATMAPLARDARVQAYITDQVVQAVDEKVDFDALVGEVVDGLAEALNRPRLTVALQLLRQPAVDGLQSAVRNATTRLVSSDAFGTVWDQSLRTTHGQGIAALSGDPNALLAVNNDGLGVRLGPIIAEVKQRLVNQGFALADRIPAIERTIVIADGSSMPQLQLGYRTAVSVGYWLPVVVLLMLVGGVLASVRRHRAAVWAAVGLGLGGLLIVGAVTVGRSLVAASVPPTVMPSDVARLFYDTATDALADLAWVTVVLAVVIGLIAWFSGPFAPARRMRAGYDSLTARLRTSVESSGVSTGRFGEALYNQRFVLRALIGVGAAVFLFFNRPLHLGTILGCAAVCLVILLVLSLVERPQPAALMQSAPLPPMPPGSEADTTVLDVPGAAAQSGDTRPPVN